MIPILSILRNISDFPKTLFFNFRMFTIRTACCLPVKVSRKVHLGKMYRGCIEIDGEVSRYMIELGYKGAGFVSENRSSLTFWNGGKLVFRGKCIISEGFNIHCDGGHVELGAGFYANRNFELQSENRISIGENVLAGWNISIRDTDGHETICDGITNSIKEPVFIDDRVWIASQCTILKGSSISTGSVIGCNSLVCGLKMNEACCLVAGTPAKIKKHNFTW